MGRLVDEQWEFLKDVAKLITFAEEQDVQLTAGEVYRTHYQQKHYISTGRSQTMKSMHLKRLAIDVNLFVDGNLTWEHEAYKPLGDYWESLNSKNKWGGNWRSFKDVPHFQRTV